MSEEDWVKIYKGLGAIWMHGGNPKQPHALLTSGSHSDGFFDSGLVTGYPRYLDVAARNIVGLIMNHFQGCVPSSYHPQFVHRVVGPAMGAITLAHDIARCLNFTHSNRCRCSFTEKDGDTMVFKRNLVQVGEQVIVCEDVITSGGTVQKVIDAVEMAGGRVLPYVAALVNRSDLTHIGDRKIIALINRPMPIWSGVGCPLCVAGSEAIRPKVDENWERLNAIY